jgi:inner membrane protein
MQGTSHLLVGLTAGIVFDSVTHVSGPPLIGSDTVTESVLVSKAVYYIAVGFGALLPDMDNPHSIIGQRLGRMSKEIQSLVGHRTLFHSLLGLALGSLLAMGLEQLVSYLLALRGLALPASIISGSHLIFVGVLFGSIIHIVCDALTIGGVPLLWPIRKRFGFPPNPDHRFRTGTWPETVIVWSFMILVAIGVLQSYLVV